MKRSLTISRPVVLLAAAMTLGLGAFGARQPVLARSFHDTCGAVGLYTVGQAVTPIRPVMPRTPTRQPAASRSTQSLPAVPVPFTPRGTLDVLSYAGCGQQTRGSFSVQYGIARPLPASPQRASGTPGALAQPVTPSRTLNGTFSAAGGSGTGSTVSVKAVLTTTTQDAHARTRTVVTRTTIDVTGSLAVAPDNRSAVLTFTQPGGSSANAVVLYGYRGLDRPNNQ